ncbi:hypothetical protein PN36_33575 [Candidatus Thiomargarita nelsonii]|uniref:Uncharacterized protein n=1 Tax=Candidatus Thiomargarita nelsonii TaxID=1003181 RepID=A0A4E0QV15_9GAMM|nr:hypothetical protein PN36_33575 [Candidatus Thiomargarita nelsonii]
MRFKESKIYLGRIVQLLYGYANAATPYKHTANNITTDAQPLIAHAQGIKSGAMRDSPNGNGIPIQKASGTISMSEIKTFAKSGNGVSHWSKGGNAISCRA